MKKKNNAGFTLVELIVVIAILAVLAAILVPQYVQYVGRAEAAVCASNRAEIERVCINAQAVGDYPTVTEAYLELYNNETDSPFHGDLERVCPSGGEVSWFEADEKLHCDRPEHGGTGEPETPGGETTPTPAPTGTPPEVAAAEAAIDKVEGNAQSVISNAFDNDNKNAKYHGQSSLRLDGNSTVKIEPTYDSSGVEIKNHKVNIHRQNIFKNTDVNPGDVENLTAHFEKVPDTDYYSTNIAYYTYTIDGATYRYPE